jgi:hypothetical protein
VIIGGYDRRIHDSRSAKNCQCMDHGRQPSYGDSYYPHGRRLGRHRLGLPGRSQAGNESKGHSQWPTLAQVPAEEAVRFERDLKAAKNNFSPMKSKWD